MDNEPKNLDISKLENVKKEARQKNESTCNLLLDVGIQVSAILGETDISLKQVLDVTKGSIIKLDNKTTQPVKLLANGYEIASGEVVIIEDNFGIRITEIASKEE